MVHLWSNLTFPSINTGCKNFSLTSLSRPRDNLISLISTLLRETLPKCLMSSVCRFSYTLSLSSLGTYYKWEKVDIGTGCLKVLYLTLADSTTSHPGSFTVTLWAIRRIYDQPRKNLNIKLDPEWNNPKFTNLVESWNQEKAIFEICSWQYSGIELYLSLN